MPTLTVTARTVDGGPATITRMTIRDPRTTRARYHGEPAAVELPAGIYTVMVEARGYRRARRFAQIVRSTTVAVRVLARPDQVRPVFDPFPMPSRLIPPVAISAPRRACLRNLVTKMAVTPVIADALDALVWRRIKQDRMWVDAPSGLRRRTLEADAFLVVSGALHEPPPGYQRAGSVKTADPVANLQLTWFTAPGLPDVCEIDIDNRSGLAHAVDVATHAITGSGTHPYDIRELLVGWQGLYPGYRLVPRDAA